MNLPKRKKFRRTTLTLAGLFCFLAGLGLARIGGRIEAVMMVIPGCMAVVTLRKKNINTLICICLFAVSLGWWRGGVYMERLNLYDGVMKQRAVVMGTALSDAVYSENSQLTFDIEHIHSIEPVDADLVGKMIIEGFGATMVYRGDVVQVEGKPFPQRGGRQAKISFADIKVLGRSDSEIETLRRRFVAGTQSALPEPHASFGMGPLVGQRNTLPDATTDTLATVGLTHIIAVSGYNLTILVRAMRNLSGKRSKYQSVVLSAALIILFLLFTGLSPSIVRAAIVSMLSLAAWYYGRVIKPLLIIFLAAGITAAWNPLYLWSDIGWYLSFLAFFGVLIIAPLLTKRFWRKEPGVITMLIIESVSAQIMTMPLILYIFGEVSLISLPANVLIVPLVPAAMVLALVSGLAGMLIPALSGWVAWPAKILMTYMLDAAALLGKVPHALAKQNITLWQMLSLYIFIIAFSVVLWDRTGNRHDIITETKGKI